jgi:hypothetical protein
MRAAQAKANMPAVGAKTAKPKTGSIQSQSSSQEGGNQQDGKHDAGRHQVDSRENRKSEDPGQR